MSFALRVPVDHLAVEPGTSVPVTLEVENKGGSAEQFEVSVEGLDPEWVAIPVPMMTVEAAESSTERIFLKPPRSSESVAGTYPFVLVVRSLASGSVKRAQAVLDVRTFFHLTLDVQPRKAVVGFQRETSFQVSATNLGNSEQNIQMFANDPDDGFVYEFDGNQVALAPGQQRSANLTVSARKRSLLANPRLQNVSITARSTTHPAVAASSQVQVEQRALATPGSFIVTLIVAILAASWFLTIPKPPSVESFLVTPSSIQSGETVTLTWSTQDADSVLVRRTDSDQQLKLSASGSHQVSLDITGRISFTLTPLRGDLRGRPETAELEVRERPVTPEPAILEWDIVPKQIRLREAFQVNYRFNDAVVQAVLEPLNVELNPALTSMQFTAMRAGVIPYTIVVQNKDGKVVRSEPIQVTVIEASEAVIVNFSASAMEVPAGSPIQLRWELSKASRAELRWGTGNPVVVDSVRGDFIVQVLEDTTFTLVAFDADDRPQQQSVEVRVETIVPPPNDPMDPADGQPSNADGKVTSP